MSHEAEEHLQLLEQLLLNERFGYDYQNNHNRNGQTHPHETGTLPESSLHDNPSVVRETRADPGREQRKGAPEVIFAETKEVPQIIAMAHSLLAGSGRAIISRMRAEMQAPISAAFAGYPSRVSEAARSMVIYSPTYVRRSTGGRIGVISAGTSDIPVAEEAILIAEEMGCHITRIYDVGVAGLHRLLRPLRDLLSEDVDVIITVAGMDGALPSVVAGLVPVPVIGLPTSIGYGIGGKGVAALLSMLQTCAPGLAVVNIDNGVGAGITAALIANRVAAARTETTQREQQVQ